MGACRLAASRRPPSRLPDSLQPSRARRPRGAARPRPQPGRRRVRFQSAGGRRGRARGAGSRPPPTSPAGQESFCSVRPCEASPGRVSGLGDTGVSLFRCGLGAEPDTRGAGGFLGALGRGAEARGPASERRGSGWGRASRPRAGLPPPFDLRPGSRSQEDPGLGRASALRAALGAGTRGQRPRPERRRTSPRRSGEGERARQGQWKDRVSSAALRINPRASSRSAWNKKPFADVYTRPRKLWRAPVQRHRDARPGPGPCLYGALRRLPHRFLGVPQSPRRDLPAFSTLAPLRSHRSGPFSGQTPGFPHPRQAAGVLRGQRRAADCPTFETSRTQRKCPKAMQRKSKALPRRRTGLLRTHTSFSAGFSPFPLLEEEKTREGAEKKDL